MKKEGISSISLYDRMSTNYLSLRSTVIYVSSGVQPSTGTFYTVSTNGIPVWTSTLNGHIHISSLIGSTMIGHSTTLNLLTVNSTVTTSTLSTLDLTTRSLGVSTLTGSSLTITNMDASGPVSIGTRLQASVDGSNMFWTSLRGTGTEVDRVGFGIKGNVSTGLVDSLLFNTNSLNRMFITSSGNVGIGTANPGSKLHIIGDSDTIQLTTSSLGYNNTFPSTSILFKTNVNADNYPLARIKAQDTSDGTSTYRSILTFETNSKEASSLTERMRINEDGNVGIGTASPSGKLHLFGVTDSIFIMGNASAPYNQVQFAYNQVGNQSQANYLSIQMNNQTSPFSITGFGHVGIGITNPSYKLHVVGDIYASANVIAMSDQRVKRDIQPLGQTLNRLSSLHGYTYFRDGKDQREMGLIAQEVMSVFPEAVHYDKDQDRYGVNYGSLVAPLLESIKELKTHVDTLTDMVLRQQHLISSIIG